MATADRIVFNADVRTLSAALPRARAIAVRAGRICRVGADADVLPLAGPQTQRIDAGGRTVVPGFCDAHVHFASFGLNLLRLADVSGAGSIAEMLEAIREQAVRSPIDWIVARGFDQEQLAERRFPTRQDLDRISATRPILLVRMCGHAAVANTAAVQRLSAAERAAGDPESGLYIEESLAAFYRRMPAPTDAELEEAVLRAADVALRTGITSVGCILDSPDQIGAFSRLHRRGRLPLRVTLIPHYSLVASLHACGIGTTFGDPWLKFGGAKLFSDGSLGARTALLAAPYADDAEHPDNRGVRIYDPEDLKRRAVDAQEKGFQLVIHAIGDQANREVLDAIEHALGPDGDNAFHRHRIEHASLLPPEMIERMAKRRIVAVVQPQFVRSDTWLPERVGPERAGWAYPFRRMLDAGIPLALSSDCPVEKMDAFACLDAAVDRAAWSPGERLTVDEALRAYCLGGAYALHADHYLGTLEEGKAADFVVLSGNLDAVAAHAAGLRAEKVFVDGEEAGIRAPL